MKKDLNYYLNLPWTYRFEWSDEDSCYIASVAELKGCMSDGENIEEASHMIKDALKSYIESSLTNGDAISEPPRKESCKGSIIYRTTPEKHCKLLRKAASQGISVNKLIDEAIEKELKSA